MPGHSTSRWLRPKHEELPSARESTLASLADRKTGIHGHGKGGARERSKT